MSLRNVDNTTTDKKKPNSVLSLRNNTRKKPKEEPSVSKLQTGGEFKNNQASLPKDKKDRQDENFELFDKFKDSDIPTIMQITSKLMALKILLEFRRKKDDEYQLAVGDWESDLEAIVKIIQVKTPSEQWELKVKVDLTNNTRQVVVNHIRLLEEKVFKLDDPDCTDLELEMLVYKLKSLLLKAKLIINS